MVRVLSVCRRQTRGRYELNESLLESDVDSLCFCNTPCAAKGVCCWPTVPNLFVRPPILRVCVSQQSVFFSVAVGLRVVSAVVVDAQRVRRSSASPLQAACPSLLTSPL